MSEEFLENGFSKIQAVRLACLRLNSVVFVVRKLYLLVGQVWWSGVYWYLQSVDVIVRKVR